MLSSSQQLPIWCQAPKYPHRFGASSVPFFCFIVTIATGTAPFMGQGYPIPDGTLLALKYHIPYGTLLASKYPVPYGTLLALKYHIPYGTLLAPKYPVPYGTLLALKYPVLYGTLLALKYHIPNFSALPVPIVTMKQKNDTKLAPNL